MLSSDHSRKTLTHSRPSYRPSPLVAHVAWMNLKAAMASVRLFTQPLPHATCSPLSLSQAVQTELIGDLGGVHGVWQILLVGKDEEKSIPQFVFVEHSLQFFASFRHTLSIVGINDKDYSLGVLKVCWRDLSRNGLPSRALADSQCLHRGLILSCPPTSHTVNEIFLYSTVSTLKPG